MKIGTYNQLRILCMVSLAASCGLTGCKSAGSWGMPKMSWNREPSATTLAGSETPKLPESPANKYSPSAIASVGAGTSSAGSTSGNKAPSYGYAGQTPSTTTPTNSPATAGLAASANGYQTGPYTVGQKTGTTGIQSAAGSLAAGQHNPYGGSYAGMTPGVKTPEMALPNSVKHALPSPSTSTGYPAPTGHNIAAGYGPPTQLGGAAYASNPGNLPPLPGSATALASSPYAPASGSLAYPPAASSVASNASQPLPSTPTLPIALPGQPAAPSYPGVSAPVQTVSGPAAGSVYTQASQPQASQPQAGQPANRYSGVYQPGTTARATTYNFGSVSPAAATAASPAPAATALPPNTASGAGPGMSYPAVPVYR